MYKKPAKRWWPCFIRIYVEFQKRGTSHSHFLAGPTFVPLWVSHKLKTNPILFFSFFSFFQKGKATEKPILLRFLRYVLRSSAWKIPLFRAKKRKPLSFEVLGFGTAQRFHRWPSPFGDGHAWEGFSSLPGFCLAISIPPSENQTPKWRFSRHFFGWQKRFFSSSSE